MSPPEELEREFGLESLPREVVPRFNIAPGQPVLVVTGLAPTRAEFFRWGLVPFWAKDPKIGHRLINARAETLREKPSFREALKRRRCLVLADGFYEWRKDAAGKTPIYLRLHSRRPFAFAGLWERWASPAGEELRTCTIITCPPNAVVRPIHDRMPVILPPEARPRWLEEDPAGAAALDRLLAPLADAELVAHPVATVVNSPAHDEPACIEPVPVGHAPRSER